VQQEQVDLVDAELADGLVEGVQGLVVSVVADPELRLDEDLGPIQTGNADALADLALVEVRRGGVDQTVTDAQCLGHGGGGFLRWGWEDTETECGDRRSTGESWFTPPPKAGHFTGELPREVARTAMFCRIMHRRLTEVEGPGRCGLRRHGHVVAPELFAAYVC